MPPHESASVKTEQGRSNDPHRRLRAVNPVEAIMSYPCDENEFIQIKKAELTAATPSDMLALPMVSVPVEDG